MSGYNLRNRENLTQPERYRQDLQRNNSLAANPLPYASTNTLIPSNVFSGNRRGGNTKKYRVRSKKNKSRRHKKTRSKRRPGCVRGAWYCK
jgi:hypothetical protein